MQTLLNSSIESHSAQPFVIMLSSNTLLTIFAQTNGSIELTQSLSLDGTNFSDPTLIDQVIASARTFSVPVSGLQTLRLGVANNSDSAATVLLEVDVQ